MGDEPEGGDEVLIGIDDVCDLVLMVFLWVLNGVAAS